MTKCKRISKYLGSFGVISLTIVALEKKINSFFSTPDVIFTMLLILGLLSISIVFICFIVHFINYILNLRSSSVTTHQVKYASESDLIHLNEFCESQIPGAFATIQRWNERFSKNNKIIYVINQIDESPLKKQTKIVGGFSLFPISEKTAKLLENEKMTGIEFNSDHILSSSEKPYGVYIAWVVAKGKLSKGYTLSKLKDILFKYMKKNVKIIYTKPTTRDGLRLTISYKFMPLNNLSKCELNRVCRRKVG